MIALTGLMQIVPAHDRDAYDGIPHLPVLPTAVASTGSAASSM